MDGQGFFSFANYKDLLLLQQSLVTGKLYYETNEVSDKLTVEGTKHSANIL